MFKEGDYVIRKNDYPGEGTIVRILEIHNGSHEPTITGEVVYKSVQFSTDIVNWYVSRVEKATPLYLFLAGIEVDSDEL